MARYKTLTGEEAAAAIERAKMEPLVVDGKLMAIIAGTLRIYASKDQIVISEQEAKP